MAKSKKAQPNSAALDFATIEKLAQLMGKNGLMSLEWESAELRVSLSKSSGMHSGVQMAPMQMPAQAQSTVAAPAAAPAASSATAAPAANPKHKKVLSPFVGTFYRQPNPKADPYAREGQVIKKGDVLCIIEAMKLMNEIESEFSGKVISVLVESGQPVQFGEPLFIIET